MRNKVFLTFLSALSVLFFWHYVGTKVILKDDSSKSFSKLQCVSYAPFTKDESPYSFEKGLVLKEENIRKDLELFSKYTNCIRTYSTVGLELIPKVAKELNMQMLMGAWIGKSDKDARKEFKESWSKMTDSEKLEFMNKRMEGFDNHEDHFSVEAIDSRCEKWMSMSSDEKQAFVDEKKKAFECHMHGMHGMHGHFGFGQ